MINKVQYQHYTDSALLDVFFKTKDNEWLSILFPRYTLLVYGVCMKYLKNEQNAKDSTQQIFEKCIDELHKYRVAYFKSWLYMITKNHCLMQLRKHPLKNTVDIDIADTSYLQNDLTTNKDDLLLKEVTLDTMMSCLNELNTEQRQCITLFYLEKKSYQQIGELLHLDYLQVKSYIQNGKRNLKLLVDKKMKQYK